MSELAGKPKYSEKDCEIVYVEEKAPEPWIQRESFYNKDLPIPEDDDERLSEAKHIGSFMVPSPLMRLKTPSSMSSFQSDRSDDGRISPVPSLDRSIKSERRDSDPSLTRSQSGLGSTESLPQLHGLFGDSKVSVIESNIMNEDAQAIGSSPLVSKNVELYDDSSDNEHDYLVVSGAAGIVDGKLGLASLMEPEISATKQFSPNEGLQHVNNQAYDPVSGVHSKSTEQGIETTKINNDAVKVEKGHLGSSAPGATKGARHYDLSDSNRNALKNSSINAENLAEGSMNASNMETSLGVAGSSAIPAGIVEGTSAIAVGPSTIAAGSCSIAAGSSVIAPLAALGAAGMLLSELSDRDNQSISSENENLETGQRKDFISKEENSADGFGNASLGDRTIPSSVQRKGRISDEADVYNEPQYGTDYDENVHAENFPSDGHTIKQQEYQGDNELNGIGYGTLGDGNLRTENSQFDGHIGKYDQQENEKEFVNEVSGPAIVSTAGCASSGILGEHEMNVNESKSSGPRGVGISDVLETGYNDGAAPHQITTQNLDSGGYVSPTRLPPLNSIESADVSLEEAEGQNMQKSVNPAIDMSLEEGATAKNVNPNEALETPTMKKSSQESAEKLYDSAIQSEGASLRLGREAETGTKQLEASSFGDQILPDVGMVLVAGAVPTVIGTSAEIVTGSEMAVAPSSEILGLSESVVKIDENRPEVTNDVMCVPNELIRESDTEISTRDYLGNSKQSDLAGMSNLTREHPPALQSGEYARLGHEQADGQLLPVDLNSIVDRDLNNLQNEGGDQDNSFMSPNGIMVQDITVPSELGISGVPRDSYGAHFGAMPRGSDVHMEDQYSNFEVNIDSKNIPPRPLNENELNSILYAFDSLLHSEMNDVADHLSANDIKSDDYAKAWFESNFSGPEFSPTLSEKASSIYTDRGPVGLAEMALDLMKLNSDELLALDSRNDILKKLNSDMNPDEASIAELESCQIAPEVFSSLQDNYFNELERRKESEYDSKLNLLVAKCRNAEELLKQLSEIIKEMNEDINELTRQNNDKSLRIKILEDALQKRN